MRPVVSLAEVSQWTLTNGNVGACRGWDPLDMNTTENGQKRTRDKWAESPGQWVRAWARSVRCTTNKYKWFAVPALCGQTQIEMYKRGQNVIINNDRASGKDINDWLFELSGWLPGEDCFANHEQSPSGHWG